MKVLLSSLKLNMVTLKDFAHILKSTKFIQHNKQHHMKTLPSGEQVVSPVGRVGAAERNALDRRRRDA